MTTPGRRSTLRLRIRSFLPLTIPVLTCALVVLPGAIRAQDTPAPPAAQPVGTGRIAGQVVAADNGMPVKRAQVMVTGSQGVAAGVAGGIVGGLPALPPGEVFAQSGVAMSSGLPPGMVRRQVETDDAGRFEFSELPSGQFIVMVSPPTGFVRPERSESVKLTDGQSATMTIKLGRAGAITGRVLDESGEPLTRVSVHAMRRDAMTGGRLQPVGSGAGMTDDLGHFRVYDLPPGDYYLRGSYIGSQMMRLGPSGTTPANRTGYGPTFYPGSPTLEGARRITVRSGQDTTGVEFSLQRVQLGRIIGRAVDSEGNPLVNRKDGARGSVMISSHDEPNSGRGGNMRPDGSFEITDVAPGDYDVFAQLIQSQGVYAQREGVTVPVTVNGNDVTVDLQTNTGATISGHVTVEGDVSALAAPTTNPAAMPRTTVSLRIVPGSQSFVTSYGRPAQVADDGSFELKGVRGTVMLFASGPRQMLKSVFLAGQDVTAKALTFRGTERITDADIVLTTNIGGLQGVVTDGGQPAPGVWVLVFPDDPDRWFPGSPFVAVARTLTAVPETPARHMTAAPGLPPIASWTPVVGGFSTSRLLPGRYLVTALPGGDQLPLTDRESLERLRGNATPVIVTAGEPATVQLRLPR